MEENEILDGSPDGNAGKPSQLLKVFSILSYVGNGLIGLIFLIAMLYFFMFIEAFNSMVSVADPSGVYLVLIAVFMVFFVLVFLCILGTYKMHVKQENSGLVLYLIGNGIWILITALGIAKNPSNLLFTLPSIAFCIVFITEMRKIKQARA